MNPGGEPATATSSRSAGCWRASSPPARLRELSPFEQTSLVFPETGNSPRLHHTAGSESLSSAPVWGVPTAGGAMSSCLIAQHHTRNAWAPPRHAIRHTSRSLPPTIDVATNTAGSPPPGTFALWVVERQGLGKAQPRPLLVVLPTTIELNPHAGRSDSTCGLASIRPVGCRLCAHRNTVGRDERGMGGPCAVRACRPSDTNH